MRIGVGHPGDRSEVIDYVLQRASQADEDLVVGSIGAGLEALKTFLEQGSEKAMHWLHSRPVPAASAVGGK
jgi:PTH1 family peptidyl-tRNA hydrolase